MKNNIDIILKDVTKKIYELSAAMKKLKVKKKKKLFFINFKFFTFF